MLFEGKFTADGAAFDNRITRLFGIQYPIIQAGMIWASGWRLAAAVSNAGGLGIIGAGSMYPDTLREHIQKYKQASDKPFAVNLPLLYPDIEKHVAVILEENVPIVFTSAGNPKTWTSKFKEQGLTVVHVVSSAKFAKKCQEAGVDAVVAEGFEAGGHNGREETTTLCLIPSVRESITIPLIAAGGIATGRAMYAMMALGAEGVQMGSRFVCSPEASSNVAFKEAVVAANEGDTVLTLKKLTPVRLIKNEFYKQVQEAEDNCMDVAGLTDLLGRARAKKGMFEGDLNEGELEIGQISSIIKEIKPAAKIVEEVWNEFRQAAANPFSH
ncbi:MAG: nitronate monooxygenase [Bacteroidetes bacterium]|nr:nitronate monooxygenase [Bacteroidota bacterium]